MLRDIAAAVLERIAPEAAEKGRDDKTAEQSVQLSDVPDGGYLTGTLDAETTALLRAALGKFTPDAAPFRGQQRAGATRTDPLAPASPGPGRNVPASARLRHRQRRRVPTNPI